MRILITGATGFTGSHLCEYLSHGGHTVIGFIRNELKAGFLDSISIPYVIGNVTDQSSLEAAMQEGFDVVINAIGYVSDTGPMKVFREINVEGTRNIANAMVNTGIDRLIHISSTSYYGKTTPGGDEMTPVQRLDWFNYGITKFEVEEVLKSFKTIKTTYIRPVNIVGRRDKTGFIPRYYDAMSKNPFWINHGKSISALVYIDDVCEAVKLCIENPETSVGEAYNLCSSERVSIREITTILNNEIGMPIPRLSIGFRLGIMMATLSEYFYKLIRRQPTFSQMGMFLIGQDIYVSTKKIENQLGWKSTKTIEEMLQEWVNWKKEVID